MPYREPESLIFILGSQRSGTTWLANIFDSSPDTLLFMEPFAPAYGLFPDFPETSLFLAQGSDQVLEMLREEFLRRISKNKSLVLYRSRLAPEVFKLEKGIYQLTRVFFGLLPKLISSGMGAFQLLNLNRFDPHFPIPRKSQHPSTWIVKELRLAGKVPLLKEAFPGAHYIVIMRHPAATVHSMLKQFDRGGLRELRSEIDHFVEKIAVQSIADDYAEIITRCQEGNLTQKLAFYWRVSYETLYQQLDLGAEHTLLVYEALASKPLDTAVDLFNRAGRIPFSLPVKEYIQNSSTKEPAQLTPITTIRNSKQSYRSWQNEIDPQILDDVIAVTGDSFLMPYFDPYY